MANLSVNKNHYKFYFKTITNCCITHYKFFSGKKDNVFHCKNYIHMSQSVNMNWESLLNIEENDYNMRLVKTKVGPIYLVRTLKLKIYWHPWLTNSTELIWLWYDIMEKLGNYISLELEHPDLFCPHYYIDYGKEYTIYAIYNRV